MEKSNPYKAINNPLQDIMLPLTSRLNTPYNAPKIKISGIMKPLSSTSSVNQSTTLKKKKHTLLNKTPDLTPVNN
ncbi:hypothetical protein [Fluviicola taffensis]|nr:hypothetical protein [Fluviicola taffensis]